MHALNKAYSSCQTSVTLALQIPMFYNYTVQLPWVCQGPIFTVVYFVQFGCTWCAWFAMKRNQEKITSLIPTKTSMTSCTWQMTLLYLLDNTDFRKMAWLEKHWQNVWIWRGRATLQISRILHTILAAMHNNYLYFASTSKHATLEFSWSPA